MATNRVIDEDTAAWLALLAKVPLPAFGEQTPAQARAAYAAAPKPAGDVLARVVDAVIPGPAGPIPVRAYAATDDTGLPVVAFFHGGGWVLSGIDGHDSLCRRIAATSGALVVSVEYRLAPEDPFPAGHDDCWAATAWLAEHADELGGDASRLAVCGDSAGGNLAATVALRARDEGLALCLQALIYPCIDPDPDRPSHHENAEGFYLTEAGMQWFWDQYVGAEHRGDPYAVPMRAADLAGVAPALVITADLDPLRDEGEAYAARLAAAGVATTCSRHPGVVHGFVSRWEQMSRAHDAHAEVAAALRGAFKT